MDVGRWTKPAPKKNIVIEIEYQTDTLYVPQEAEIEYLYTEQEAEKDQEFFYKEIDTLFVFGKDSIGINQKIVFDPIKEIFAFGMEITYKKMETVLIDSIFTDRIESIETPINQPFYDTFVFGSILTFIATILVALLL